MDESEFEVNPPVKLLESVLESPVPEILVNIDEFESFINEEASSCAKSEELFVELLVFELDKDTGCVEDKRLSKALFNETLDIKNQPPFSD